MSSHERKPRLAVNAPVFFTSGALLIAFLVFGVAFPEVAASVFPRLLTSVATYFGWFYVASIAFFIVFVLGLMLSKKGRLRLGDDDERPEFGRLTWFSMLFSAGMGIGLVFYGVAEPVMHYVSPPAGDGETAAAAAHAIPLTYFHWGFHGWAIYTLMALGIAYFAYRHKLPLTVRSCFYPLLGERIHGPIGHAIDILAVFGTLFGLATSLGLGAMQVNSGLHRLFDVPRGTEIQLWLIAIITACATLSLLSGVDRGIRRLSELNLVLAALLAVFVLAVGPTGHLATSFFENLFGYAGEITDRGLALVVEDDKEAAWTQSWTIFYWGWWISWSPFVGMFIARISRGRTIREFILGVLLVPTGVTFIWFTIFGGTALHLELTAGGGIADAVASDVSTAVYVVLERLPYGGVTSLLAAGVITIFFVTSSDSASFVVDMLTSGGHPNPPRWQRVFWAAAEGACAGVLLYAGGKDALKAMQAAVISIGLPFCLLLLLIAVSLARDMWSAGARAGPSEPK